MKSFLLKNRIYLKLISAIFLGITAFLLLQYLLKKDDGFIFSEVLDKQSFFYVIITMMTIAIASLLLDYLAGTEERDIERRLFKHNQAYRNEIIHRKFSSNNEVHENKKKIDLLNKAFKDLKKNKYLLNEDEQKSILKEIRDGVLTDASNSILKEIEAKYSKNIQFETQLSGIHEQLETTRIRLGDEISALSRRGNVNLVIGVITTMIAIGILTTTVINSNILLTSETLVSHFAPRLTLSLFVEIFSFFFLKLYKSSLNEIKYFQNELTNIELKFVALDSALRLESNESIHLLIHEFAITDRNSNKAPKSTEQIDTVEANKALSSITKIISSINK